MKINMHISDELLRMLKEYRERTGVSMSEIIRRAVLSFIKKDAK